MNTIKGLAASPGVAIGPLYAHRPQQIVVNRAMALNAHAEWSRVTQAIAVTRDQLKTLVATATAQVGAEEAGIFEAHEMFLDDEEYVGAINEGVFTAKQSAEAAIEDATKKYADMLLALDDEYLRARAVDMNDVGMRLMRNSMPTGHAANDAPLTHPSVIFADDLTPSDTMQFERRLVLGLCTAHGGPTSHVAILSRSLGVPAVVSANFDIQTLAASTGAIVVLDGNTGAVCVDPDAPALAAAQTAQRAWREGQASAQASAHAPAITRDGVRVEVVANIGSYKDALQAVESGAEGVGLFRTEFFFMDRASAPTEEEQVTAYRAIVQALAGRPLVARLLDIGGDKAVPYLDIAPEENPFLGWRAIRMLDGREDVYLTQIRALLRASADGDLRIMLPLVSNLREIERGRALFDKARAQLRAEGHAVAASVQFGIMVEVPSAALLAPEFARYVDFFSIGTNDLTQYTLAVDRGNARVAPIASPYHPAVLRLIAMTIEAAHAAGKWCGVCGELGGDVLAVPVLLGLGLDEFSMSASAIPAVKAALRSRSRAACAPIAQHALSLTTTEAVLTYLAGV